MATQTDQPTPLPTAYSVTDQYLEALLVETRRVRVLLQRIDRRLAAPVEAEDQGEGDPTPAPEPRPRRRRKRE